TRGAGRGLPRRNRCFREPDGQAPALAQRDVIRSPIRHSVPLLRDMMTATLVRFEWHDDDPRSGTGSQIYRPLLAANDRSVQQGGGALSSKASGSLRTRLVAVTPTRWPQRLPGYRLLATWEKTPLRLVPTVPIPTTAATAIRAAIKPYS